MIKLIVAGDFCDNARVSKIIEEQSYSSLFDDDICSIICKHDIRIVNFEFPITNGKGNPIPKWGPILRGGNNSINAIKFAGFNTCTLANNHILDQGERNCLYTRDKLQESGIDTVGVGNNLDESSQILYKKVGNETLAIINCCEHEFSTAQSDTVGANPLNPIQQFYKIMEAKNNSDFVVVIVHGGTEFYQLPSPRMKEFYRFFISVGADAVINHHQHCYSGYEIYNGKPIFYGLGNFLFDKSDMPKGTWNDGYMVSLQFSHDKNPTYVLYPYHQCLDEVRVKLMDQNEQNKFYERITELNKIISNDALLENNYNEWTTKNRKRLKTIFEPYTSRLTLGLYMRNLIPSFITKKKSLEIKNYLNCESHLDALRIIINNTTE